MSEDKKRLQELDATVERLVELLMELYHERSELRLKIDESDHISV